MDTQIANLLTGGVIALVPALIVNWYTSYQAGKRLETQHEHDTKQLDKQLRAQREALSVRLKLEKIERAYQLLNEIGLTTIPSPNKLPSNKNDALNKISDSVEKYLMLFTELLLIENLYIGDLNETLTKLSVDCLYATAYLKSSFDEQSEINEEFDVDKYQKIITELGGSIAEAKVYLSQIVKDQNLI